MSKELIISAAPHETRVAILEEGQLCEVYVERAKEFALVGSIYKGRVTRVLPGMQSAFVDIGLDGDAFLYVTDVFENLEEYDEAPVGESEAEQAEQAGALPASLEAPEAPTLAGGSAAAESHSDVGAGSHIEPLPGESFGSAAPGGEYPSEQGERPRLRSGGMQDRGSERANRHGGPPRGRDRWGRRGRHQGRRGPRGRDLPPSKYASPHNGEPRGNRENRNSERFERPSRERYERPSQQEEPFLLPGESLAKYRDHAAGPPSAQSGPASEPPAPAAVLEPPTDVPARASDVTGYRKGSYTGLPSWVLADSAVPAEGIPEGPEPTATTGAPSEDGALTDAAEVEGRGVDAAEEIPPVSGKPQPPHVDADLSDEEVSALAEQLAQAKREEMHEEADADALSGGAEFEEENHTTGTEAVDAAGEIAEDEADELETEADATSSEAEAGTEEETEIETEVEAVMSASEETAPGVLEAPGAGAVTAEPSEDFLLPGETRSPRSSAFDDAPRAARIEERPRAHFQRPVRRGGRRPRGGRPPRYHGPGRRQFAPVRRPQLISEMLKAGQEIIVQIAKEPLGKKGARITSHVALPGRFLVYMPTITHIGVSRKIASAENRARLRRLVSEARGSYPGGFIVRTAAGSASDEDIRADIDFLGRTWNDIKTKAEQRKAPALMHRDLNLIERILRDYVSDDYTAIWIDSQEEYSKVLEFVGRFQPKLVNRVKLFTKDVPIFEEFGIQHELDKALRPKVWLKSGGYIVINHTEALVAIDVNTGKFVGKGSTRLEDTIVKTNIEAVKEIVRQIRLRDLGGIIVVDFIDMEERRNREKVMAALQQALESDKAPSKVLSFNEFGLVAITRKRTKQALERVLCQPCPYCTGSGMVKSVPTICYEIQNEARKMAADHDEPNLTLRVHPEIAKALKTREAMLVDELEQTTRKHVIIQSDATLHFEQYDIY
jgi:ribonuclease G